jgi:hypothetical protein
MELRSPEKISEYKAEVGSDGNVVLKKKSKINEGRRAKISGGNFEARVRRDLEEKGWIVDKWSNNVDLDSGRLVPCKRAARPIGKGRIVMTPGAGFPDFVVFQKMGEYCKVIGVEVKMNGKLSRIEKEKCAWLRRRFRLRRVRRLVLSMRMLRK